MAKGKFGGGDGSANNPYLIEDPDDLNAIRKNLSANYLIVNDLNMADGKYNTDQGWKPIENFNGVLDGGDHKIMNLYINRPAENNIGLFATAGTVGVTIKNIQLIDFEIIGYTYVASIVGNIAYSIVNCYNIYAKGKIKGYNHLCGLLAANYNAGGKNIYIQECLTDIIYTSTYTTMIFGIAPEYSWRNRYNSFENGYSVYNTSSIIKTNELIKNIYPICYGTRAYGDYYGPGIQSAFDCYYYIKDKGKIVYEFNNEKTLDLVSLPKTNDPAPYMDDVFFARQAAKTLQPKTLNKNSIFVKTPDNKYLVYDFNPATGKTEWITKYFILDNNNSCKTTQTGMTNRQVENIPSGEWKKLSEKYDSVDIVNCIVNHEIFQMEYKKVKLLKQNDQSSDAKNISKYKFVLKNWKPITSISREEA